MAKRIQIIPKNIVFPEAIVLDKEYQELYQKADRKTAEKFGKDSLAYKTITNGIDRKNITGSQFFWNTNLGLYLQKTQKVILLEDMEQINNLDEDFFKEFYADSPQIVLRTETLSYDKNKFILRDLVKQIKEEKYDFTSENPLIISNLELIKDTWNSDNEYGLLLRIGNDTKIQNDKRFAHSNNGRQIDFGEKTKTISTKENALLRVCMGWDAGLDSGCEYLGDSNNSGRVVLMENKK